MISIRSLPCLVSGVDELRFVALDGKRFVGTVGLQLRPKGASAVRQLFVHPDARRQGVGTQLIDACVMLAIEAGSESLRLSLSHCDRGVALPFYKALGFIVVGSYQDGDLDLALPLVERGALARAVSLSRGRGKEAA